MEIKEFLKVTLRELSEAISESSSELGKKVSLTNIPLRTKSMGTYGLIDFDLAVEAKKVKSTDGKAGVRVAIVEAALGGTNEVSASSITRVKFTVEADF